MLLVDGHRNVLVRVDGLLVAVLASVIAVGVVAVAPLVLVPVERLGHEFGGYRARTRNARWIPPISNESGVACASNLGDAAVRGDLKHAPDFPSGRTDMTLREAEQATCPFICATA